MRWNCAPGLWKRNLSTAYQNIPRYLLDRARRFRPGVEVLEGRLTPASSATSPISAGDTSVSGSISGFVYQDLNSNGLRDSGEPAVTDVQIVIEGTTASGPVAPITVIVDSNGAYQVPNLLPGTYSVRESAQPAGYLDGLDTRGNVVPLGGTVGKDVITNISVSAGTMTGNINFGENRPSSLAGKVWVDANRDRIHDPQEVLRAGVKVVLTGRNDTGKRVHRVVFTDSQGQYRFDNLRLGVYAINVVPPRGFIKLNATYGSQGGPRTYVLGRPLTGIVLTQGIDGVDNDFGIRRAPPRASSGGCTCH